MGPCHRRWTKTPPRSLLAGAIWALTEDIDVTVGLRSEDGQEMTIDINRVKEIVSLGDLAESEQRVNDSGSHVITIRKKVVTENDDE